MGVIRKLLQTTVFGATATTGAFFVLTRNTKLVPLSTSDAIFKSSEFKKWNPNNNPTTHDLVVKKVPFSKIKAELLKDQAKLTERFCAGVWGGAGKHYTCAGFWRLLLVD